MTKDEALNLALDWFICYQDKSMSRNNAEALTDEIIIAIKEALEQQGQVTYAGNGTSGFSEGERSTGFFLQIPPQPYKG